MTNKHASQTKDVAIASSSEIFDQLSIHADAKSFKKIFEWLESDKTSVDAHAGMKRLKRAILPWIETANLN